MQSSGSESIGQRISFAVIETKIKLYVIKHINYYLNIVMNNQKCIKKE